MNVEIAQRLAELRREKGYSQEELAENLGLSRQAVSKWERAESAPDTGNLVALAKLYGVTLDELLRIDEDIEDDIRFEAQDKTASTEAKVQAAAEQASAAAAQASVAAAKAQAASATATAQIPLVNHAAEKLQGATKPSPATASTQQFYSAPPEPAMPHQTGNNTNWNQKSQHAQAQAPTSPINLDGVNAEKKKGPWLTFPYPAVCAIIYLLAGFSMGAWHPGWLIFLTIPLYYWVAHIIESDPNYQSRGH